MNRFKARAIRLLSIVAALALAAAACTADESGDVTTTAADPSVTTVPDETDGTAAPPAEGGAFRVGMIANITTDNWWASLDTQSASQNQAYLEKTKESLFDLTLPGFVYYPEVASTEEPVAAVQEGDVWVVEQPIRDDLAWSDGTPVTAGDLAFYFEVVREFSLGANHSANFPPTVLDVSAPEDHLVRIEFDGEPGLAVWQNGVGLTDFVPSHFWEEHVEAARAAAAEITSGITEEGAVSALVEDSVGDEDPDNDLTPADVTPEMIEEYIRRAGAQEGLTHLYAVSAPMEPSLGSVTFDQWETGAFAATTTNQGYHARGNENTYYSDGSFGIVSDALGERLYGGEGSGEVLAKYLEGPFVSEILWVEHGTKDAAYERLSAGELDFVFDPTGLTSGLRGELSADPNLEFTVNTTEGFRYMAFNLRKPPMSDLAFRDAVATVIDKEQIAETVLQGAVFPGYTIVHPDLTTWYNSDVYMPGWADGEPMDTAGRFDYAIERLRDAGYSWSVEPVVNRDEEGIFLNVAPGEGLTMPDGTPVPELEILSPGPGYDPLRATFSVWIETWMNQLGIPATARPTDFNAVEDAVFPPQTQETALAWDMYLLGWGGGDPSLPGTSQVAFFHSREEAVAGGGFNTPGFNDADFDAAADVFERATTQEDAQEWTFEMERILAEQLPYVVLFRTPIIEASRANVTFPAETIMGGHQSFPNAWPNAVAIE